MKDNLEMMMTIVRSNNKQWWSRQGGWGERKNYEIEVW